MTGLSRRGAVAETVAALARAVLEVRPLASVLDPPVRIAWVTPDCVSEILLPLIFDRLQLSTALAAPGIATSDLSFLEECISNRLRDACGQAELLDRALDADDAHQMVDEAVDRLLASTLEPVRITSVDRTPFTAYAAGCASTRPVVVIASACGMPVLLCEKWIRALAHRYFVLTWETRGLFGIDETREPPPHDAFSQTADLEAVLDHFDVERAHVMGICGGAALALLFAARCPERTASLGLWHGDYQLGPDCPKTLHQSNIETLLSIAAQDRDNANLMRSLFCQSARAANARSARSAIRRDLAHLILYPFGTRELLFRYARLNVSLMTTDVRPALGRVDVPSLVVTSRDDETAHPEGSRVVASSLRGATLHVEPHGNHLSMFDACPSIVHLARTFIETTRPVSGRGRLPEPRRTH